MKIKEVMHKGATCVEPTTPVREIAKRMRDADIGAIPVKANGKLVGIVTDRDLACRALAGSDAVTTLTAKDVMTSDVVCCSADDDVEIAIDVMEAKQIRRLPVTDNRRNMIGMLSLGDISTTATTDLLSEWARSVSAHHH